MPWAVEPALPASGGSNTVYVPFAESRKLWSVATPPTTPSSIVPTIKACAVYVSDLSSGCSRSAGAWRVELCNCAVWSDEKAMYCCFGIKKYSDYYPPRIDIGSGDQRPGAIPVGASKVVNVPLLARVKPYAPPASIVGSREPRSRRLSPWPSWGGKGCSGHRMR